MFLQSPGFTLTAVAALALGIGGTSAIFSIVNVVLLRPLRVPDPEHLLVLATTAGDGSSASPAKFMHWRAEAGVLREVSAYLGGLANYAGGGAVEQRPYTRVSGDTFRCFGIPILRGRAFTAEEELPGGARVAVITESFWKRRFSGDAGMPGKSIVLNGETYTVVGVAGGFPAGGD
jgi:putative ABC transport system permease protein